MKELIFPLLLLPLAGCSFLGFTKYPPLEVVPHVDLHRYLGTWYEIASFPAWFQKGCFCTKAEYSLREDGLIKVVNTCRKNGPDGKIDRAEGKAFIVPGSNNAKLRVQFFWPFRGDYWILDLDEQYSYAVVGVPSREYCWILSRTPEMNPDLYLTLVQRLKAKGFDVSRFQRTFQPCAD
jgi:apolipoprotein D and lipocalin family protein